MVFLLTPKSRNILRVLKFYRSSISFSTRMAKIGNDQGASVAIAQMTVGSDKDENLLRAQSLTKEASKNGAKMIFFPEGCDYIGESRSQTFQLAEPFNGPSLQFYSKVAKENDIWMSLGGLHIKEDTGKKILNTHVIIDNTGGIVERYVKTHLFDVLLPEKKIDLRESTIAEFGPRFCSPVKTPCGLLSLAICYDLRFPEMSILQRRLGAQILTFPSAFTVPTGEAHWHTLLRARAIENQCYVVAAAQTGQHSHKRASYGHSLVVDPWGKIIAEIEEGTGLVYAQIDLQKVAKIRQEMPISTHRRIDLYNLLSTKASSDPGLTQICPFPSSYCTYTFGSVNIPGDCIFLKTSQSHAFVNKKPIVPYHVLVTPERPATLLKDLDAKEICDFAQTVLYTLRLLRQVEPNSTMQMGIQDGIHSGQTIEHVHVHLLPVNNELRLKQGHEESNRILRNNEEMTTEAAFLRLQLPHVKSYWKDPNFISPSLMTLTDVDEENNVEMNNGKLIQKPLVSSKHTVVIAAPNPVSEGHMLVKLKKSASELFDDVTPREISDLFQMLQYIQRKLLEIFSTNSTTVYATFPERCLVKDIMVHIIPRRKGDFPISDDIYTLLTMYQRNLEKCDVSGGTPEWALQLN